MAATKRRRYTDEERASLVTMLISEGYHVDPAQAKKGALARVAKYAKVPQSTLHRWFKEKQNPPPSNLVTEKKVDLADAFENVIWLMMGQIEDPMVVAEMSGKDMATAIGIFTDKMRLLRDQSTDNTKHSGAIRHRVALDDALERVYGGDSDTE